MTAEEVMRRAEARLEKALRQHAETHEDLVDVLVGPSADELHASEEASEEPAEGTKRWGAAMEEAWPDNQRRRRWLPWRARR